jgi:hypothetical protein
MNVLPCAAFEFMAGGVVRSLLTVGWFPCLSSVSFILESRRPNDVLFILVCDDGTCLFLPILCRRVWAIAEK